MLTMSVDDVPTDEGNAFQDRAAATGKARSPGVARRGYMHKRGLCCRGVSVTFVYCVETAKDTAIVAMESE